MFKLCRISVVVAFCLLVTFTLNLSAQEKPAPAPVPAPSPTATPAAVPMAVPATVPELTGCWTGSWVSCTNGHKGPMNAQFCKIDAEHYEVRFNGRFFKVIPFKYTAVLNVTGYENGRVLLSGSHRLGPLFGTFTYNAWATDTDFVADYCSEKDQGQFVLSRACR